MAACVVVLALGIGANAAIFTLLYYAILKPLPYPDAERLVLLYSAFPNLPAPISDHMPVSRLQYQDGNAKPRHSTAWLRSTKRVLARAAWNGRAC